jgi:hypothetical protein
MNDLHLLGRPDECAPWGDYGYILSQGIAKRDDGGQEVDLRRSGPFVPPITFPGFGNVIVTEETKHLIQRSGLIGIGAFVPVVKSRIVKIMWHEWDHEAGLTPDQLPFNGEPEEYILHNPHCQDTSEIIGNMWSWEPATIGEVIREHGQVSFCGIRDHEFDVFRVNDNFFRCIFVNEQAMKFLNELAPECVYFQLVE